MILLGTPLHGILGSVQLLADTNLDPFQTGLTDTIKTSGSTLNETLTSVLSFAKINQLERQQHKYRQRHPPDAKWSHASEMNLPPGADTNFKALYISANIALLCEEITAVLEAGQSYDGLTNRRNVTIVTEIGYEENWNYLTEPGALRRLVMNIIGNALKYTLNGSVAITLSASNVDTVDMKTGRNHVPQRMITLSVKDTGKGMSKDFMDNHLFVPFTQEDTTSSQGVGLGMSIVKSLVSLLAGKIKVNSELGKGTEVTVTVPMTPCNPNQDELGRPALDLKRRTIFVRAKHVSVVVSGFPRVVRQALEMYLRVWFQCNLLESSDDASPDMVIVEESSEGWVGDAERIAQRCGKCRVLLSVVSTTGALAKRGRSIRGYEKWERIQRTLGPDSLAKALAACVVQLQDLRGHGSNTRQDGRTPGQVIRDNADRQPQHETLGFGDNTMKVSRESSPASVTRSHPDPNQNAPLPGSDNMLHSYTGTPQERFTPTQSQSEDSSTDPSTFRILIVEDNAVNRRLLGAFLKKHGYHNVQYAENGALGVKMVKEYAEGFDVIFMGTFPSDSLGT